MMSELMLKMVFWLISAILLGFLIGWLYSKAKQREKYIIEIDSLNSIIKERNEILEKLEKKFRNQKTMIEKLTSNYEKSEEVVAQKTAQITQMQLNFDKVNSSFDRSRELKEENLKLLNEIKSLKQKDQERVKELAEFEKVLIKAEERVEETNSQIEKLKDKLEALILEKEEQQKAMELYRETIADFEEELKLYKASKEDQEFIISKDQFTHIEEQLIEYQKEIESLKKMNRELIANNTIETKKVIKNENREVDDGSVVKIFKDTYNKITKN